jgi:uncharacterized protein YjeT (DUF2065 family)
MVARILGTLLFVLIGGFVCVVGILTVRYPEASYAIRTAWKHDDVALSNHGQADQRGFGIVLTLLGIIIIYVGIS